MTRLAYRVEAAAEAVGVSEDLIYKAIRAGELRAKRSARAKTGDGAGIDGAGVLLILASDLEAWLDGLADA